MNFDPNETQLMIAQSIKDFAEINPSAINIFSQII
jgi:hypothetical protein